MGKWITLNVLRLNKTRTYNKVLDTVAIQDEQQRIGLKIAVIASVAPDFVEVH